MASIESEVDALYQKPLNEFTPARNALAKTLSGADAARVRKLPKPTVVPWAVNQLYWHARPLYDRLRAAGERLRAAQIAALKGRSADLRGATETQRKAVADAVRKTSELAGHAGSHPNADELTRTLEALSLVPELPEEPGRLTRPLQPAGFEALAGVPIRATPPDERPAKEGPARSTVRGTRVQVDREGGARAEREAKERHARELAERRRAEAELHRAEATLARATATQAQARAALERADAQVAVAERAVADARRAVKT